MMASFFEIESGPAAKFERPGDYVAGFVVRPYSVRQATDFITKQLKVDDQGRPVMMAVVEIQTDLRDPMIKDDDGIRMLYAEKFGQRKAIWDGIKAAGAEDLMPGGWLMVQYVRDDPSGKGTPLKIWASQYQPPSPGAGILTGLDAQPSAPTQPPPPPAYPTPSVPTQYPVSAPQPPVAGLAPQPDLITQARATQAVAAAQHAATPPPQPPPLNGGSDIQRVRELAKAGFDKSQIHEAIPGMSMDMIAALINV